MKTIEYTDGETVLEGAIFQNQRSDKKSPCVLVAHAWDGPNEYFNKMAEGFSHKGLNAFAIDVYGKGVRGKVDGDNAHLMNPLLENRNVLHSRLLAAVKTTKGFDFVDSDNLYALGFCFGGLCVLDLARLSPQGVTKVIAVHSVLQAPKNIDTDLIKPEILLLNGYEDPVAPPEQLFAFFDEMKKKQASWSAKIYGKTKHAFTFEGANIPELGIKYNERSAKDSFEAIDNFFNLKTL